MSITAPEGAVSVHISLHLTTAILRRKSIHILLRQSLACLYSSVTLLRRTSPTCFYTTSRTVSSSAASCPQATSPTSSTLPKTPFKAETSSNPYRKTSSNPSGTTSFQPVSSSATCSPESPPPQHKFWGKQSPMKSRMTITP